MNISDEELLYCLKGLTHILDHTPSPREMRESKCHPSVTLFQYRLGSWNSALKQAGLKNENGKNYYWYYGKSWAKNRTKAIKRACGKCEHPDCNKRLSDHGCSPDVHHIVPHQIGVKNKYFSKEGGNELSNLIVLCREHHNNLEPRI